MLIKNIIKYFYRMIFKKGFGTQRWKNMFGQFGKNSMIQYPARIQGASYTHIGENTTILSNSRIQNYIDKKNDIDGIYIGNNCYLGYGLSILNASKITIGDSVLMASNILISSENHGINPESNIPYMDQELYTRNVEIKDGVWIGQNVCILPGVTIGIKSIIGAGSIVTKDVPDYSIAVGNPAKVIKQYNFETHKWESI